MCTCFNWAYIDYIYCETEWCIIREFYWFCQHFYASGIRLLCSRTVITAGETHVACRVENWEIVTKLSSEWIRLLDSYRRMWEDNTLMVLKDLMFMLIGFSWLRIRYSGRLLWTLNPWVSWQEGNFLIIWAITGSLYSARRSSVRQQCLLVIKILNTLGSLLGRTAYLASYTVLLIAGSKLTWNLYWIRILFSASTYVSAEMNVEA